MVRGNKTVRTRARAVQIGILNNSSYRTAVPKHSGQQSPVCGLGCLLRCAWTSCLHTQYDNTAEYNMIAMQPECTRIILIVPYESYHDERPQALFCCFGQYCGRMWALMFWDEDKIGYDYSCRQEYHIIRQTTNNSHVDMQYRQMGATFPPTPPKKQKRSTVGSS